MLKIGESWLRNTARRPSCSTRLSVPSQTTPTCTDKTKDSKMTEVLQAKLLSSIPEQGPQKRPSSFLASVLGGVEKRGTSELARKKKESSRSKRHHSVPSRTLHVENTRTSEIEQRADPKKSPGSGGRSNTTHEVRRIVFTSTPGELNHETSSIQKRMPKSLALTHRPLIQPIATKERKNLTRGKREKKIPSGP